MQCHTLRLRSPNGTNNRIFNPRRACARVTVVVLCVCVCFRGPHMQLTQLSDKVGILAVLVSCSLVFKCGVFRITAFWRS